MSNLNNYFLSFSSRFFLFILVILIIPFFANSQIDSTTKDKKEGKQSEDTISMKKVDGVDSLLETFKDPWKSEEQNLTTVHEILIALFAAFLAVVGYFFTRFIQRRDKEKEISKNVDDSIEVSNTSNNSLHIQASNLIDYQDKFVGREQEIDELENLIFKFNKRQITIFGPGGIGKTRLTHKFGTKNNSKFHDGVVFVDLREATTSIGIVEDILKACGSTNTSNQIRPVDSVVELLKDKDDLLIIMDNFEQVSKFYGETIEYWLKNLPHVKILITSRVRFFGAYETPLQLDSLSLENSKKLLFERSLKVRAKTEVVELFRDQDSLHEICLKLSGIPLAIEIVSAQVRGKNLKQIKQSLEDFLMFESTGTTKEDKHNTLFKTIDWSFQLLEEEEKQVFIHLSVFKEGCDLLAFKEVIQTLLRKDESILDSLIDKSLIKVVKGTHFPRYEMYVPIYEFATIKLKEIKDSEEVKNLVSRWSEYYINYAEFHNKKLDVENAARSFDLIELELENMFAIQEQANERKDAFTSARAILSIVSTLEVRGPSRLRIPKLESALDVFGKEQNNLVLQLKLEQAKAYWAASDWDKAAQFLIEGKKLANVLNDHNSTIRILKELGRLLNDQGCCSRSLQILNKGLQLSEDLKHSNSSLHIELLIHAATALEKLNRLDESLVTYKLAENIGLSLSNKVALGLVHNRRGLALWHHGFVEKAIGEFNKARDYGDEINNVTWKPAYLTNKGLVLSDAGRLFEAVECFTEASVLHNRLGYKHWAAVNFGGWGRTLMLLGGSERLKKAEEYCQLAFELSEKIYYPENLTMHLGDLARISVYQGNYDDAILKARKAVFTEIKMGTNRSIRHFSNLSSLFYSLIKTDQLAKAFNIYNRILDFKEIDFVKNSTIFKIKEDISWIEEGSKALQKYKGDINLKITSSIKFNTSELMTICNSLAGSEIYPYPWHLLEEELESKNMKEILLFTYGSLLNKKSALNTITEEKYNEARPALAFGIKRLFNYYMPDEVAQRDMYKTVKNIQDFSVLNVQFTGMINNYCNGLVISVAVEDLENLRLREIGYDLVQTKCFYLKEKSWETRPVFVLSCEHKLYKEKWLTKDDQPPHENYLNVCKEGAKQFGNEFYSMWMDTTYLGDGNTGIAKLN